MDAGIRDGVFPGGVILIRHRGAVVLQWAWGHAAAWLDSDTRQPAPVPATPGTVYDLASISKLFTATCVMQMAEEDRLMLDEPAARYLPAFAANGKAAITVRQLLTHVAGLPMRRLWETDATIPERIARVLDLTPEFVPGSAMVYQDTNLIVLGHLIATLDGVPLDEALRRRVLTPLGLRHTRYGPLPAKITDMAPTEDGRYVKRGMIRGEVHDENAWSLGGAAGHAGLFGNAADLGVFGQTFLDGGTFDGVRLLSARSVAEMTRNQIGGLGNRGLGWQTLTRDYMGDCVSERAYGHTGFTGTSIVVDPDRELVVVLLTNRVHPTRNGPPMAPIRRAVADAACAAADAA